MIQRLQDKCLNAPWYVTNDTLRHDLNVSYVTDEIKKLGRRYANRLEEHPNMLAIDLMTDAETPRGLKKTTSRFVYLTICHWAYTLRDLYKLSNASLNVTPSDSL